mgnify:CR=1 FL=1
MKAFEFEYTNGRFLFLSFVSILALTFALSYLFVPPYFNGIPATLRVLVVTGMPIIIFAMLIRRGVKAGSAVLTENHVSIDLSGKVYDIEFSALSAYHMEYANGRTLKLKTASKELKIVSNKNFCNAVAFCDFCDELDKYIYDYNKNLNHTILRKRPFILTAIGKIYVFILTALVLAVCFYAYGKNSLFNYGPLMCVSLMLSQWGCFFYALNKDRK